MARGWDTQATAREQIAKLTGWRIPQSVYAEWESGRRLPSEANLDRLRSFYGDAPGATETPDSLVAALTAQTAAISELVAALRSDEFEIRLRALEAEVRSLRGQRAGAGSPERSVLPEIVG